MGKKDKKADRGATSVAKCPRCQRELQGEAAERVLKSGLCDNCYRDLTFKSLTVEQTADVVEEIMIAGMYLKKGDVIEIVTGRSKGIIARFKAWSTKLYALVIETDDTEMLIPYKYIKMMSKRRLTSNV